MIWAHSQAFFLLTYICWLTYQYLPLSLSLAVPIHQSIIQPASEQQALKKFLALPKGNVPYRYQYQQTHSTPDRKNLPAKGSGKPI